jgi:hypothetical protein
VILMMERDGPNRAKLTTFKRVRRQRRIVATQRGGLLVEPRDIGEGPAPKIPPETVVDTVRASPGMTIAELARRLEVVKKTAERYADAGTTAGHSPGKGPAEGHHPSLSCRRPLFDRVIASHRVT